ncbi:hypothetical protein [Methylobacterium sp. AMS5]|uniref:hypothetical protein n=1 Tax=Methylobacterium sp. AMS5 TaxID=925818 RepID=UPI00074F82E9|nr:hypothetical protein [Methylobacterium sp. AMS5]AMB48318.1 hypothetical protein Y590_25455 [Methylobacterium sp. AMS5]
MDILSTTNLVAAASLGLSGLLSGFSIRAFRRARAAETETNERTVNVASHLGSLLKSDQFQMIADRDVTIRELNDVIDHYRNELLKKLEQEQTSALLMNAAAGTLAKGAETINHLGQVIREKNTELALDEETFAEIDLALRKIYPQLPENGYDPAEVIETIFEAIIASGFVGTYGGEENEKGIIARVIEKLTGEVEGLQEHAALLEGEIEDRQMKHGHLMDVLQSRNLAIESQTATIEELDETVKQQAEVIGELREEKAMVEQELAALKTVANDDSADADRYADRLAAVDALLVKLHTRIVEKNVFFDLTPAETGTLVEAGVRYDVRINPPSENGVVGRADQLAA